MPQLGLFLFNVIEFVKWLLFARILLSWFPAIPWYQQPWRAINDATEPMMAPFRQLIPPIAGLDLSPIVLFFALGLLQSLVRQFL